MLPDLSLSDGGCFGGLSFGIVLSGEMVATVVGYFVGMASGFFFNLSILLCVQFSLLQSVLI